MAIAYQDGKLIMRAAIDREIVSDEDMMPPISSGSVIRVGKRRFVRLVNADRKA